MPAGTTVAGGRLSIVRLLGEGGMGVVYEAFDAERRASVALKTLSRLDASGIYRLKNEFRSLADVSHPNLVRLYDLFADGERWFFTMELVRGVRFDRWVRPRGDATEASAGTLDEPRLRSALPELLAAIQAIHRAGRLHRDLKPSNVLVTDAGRVVVLDFGLASGPEPGGVGQTLHDDGIRGTPAYMAPEQAAGGHASRASDYYALGVLLFEALSGRLPFAGQAHDILVDKQRRAAPEIRQCNPQAPADLAACCDKLLRLEPSARPGAELLAQCFGASVPRAAATSAAASVPAELEPLLGRASELEQLHAAYETARAGQPVVLFVAGESGIGKSALLACFLDRLRADGHAAVLAGRCHERESVPFKGFDNIIDELSRLLRRAPREEVAALLPREVHALARIFPVLGRIDAVAHAPRQDIADAQELRRRAFAVFCELVARIRDRRPLVLCVDDAQWLDRDAVTMLDYMLGRPDPAPALIVLVHRSEGADEHPALAVARERTRQHVKLQRRELALGPLPFAAAEELAHRLLGSGGGQRAAALAEQSRGSPFLLAELARLAQAAGGFAPTLEQALLAQVNARSERGQRLIEVLAVAARPLPVRLALDAACASYQEVDELHAARLLSSRDAGEERTLECYHDKIRESVIGALAPEPARALHASLLAAMLAHGAADAEHLALHAQGAGDPAAAARYAAQAGDAAQQAMAFDRAASHYQCALELGEHDDDGRRELLEKLGTALAGAGRGADAASALLDAAQGQSAHDAFDLVRRAAEQLLISGHIDRGKALLDQVLRAVGLRLPPSPSRALLAVVWEQLRLRLRGLAFRERAGALPEAQRRELAALHTASRLGGIDLLQGAALNGRYARRALDSGALEHAAIGLGLVAFSLAAQRHGGAQGEVARVLERSEALARRSGDRAALACHRFHQACSRQWSGVAQEQLRADSEQAIELLRDLSDAWYERGAAYSIWLSASESLGRFRPCAEVAGVVDEAWRRGDLYTAVTLTNAGRITRLCQGDVEGLTWHVERARRAFRRPRDYSFVDISFLTLDCTLGFYADDPIRVFQRIQSDLPAIERALLLRAPMLHFAVHALRAAAASRLIAADPAHAAAWLTSLRRDVGALGRVRLPQFQGSVHRLRGALALSEGRLEHSIEHMRAALSSFERAGCVTQGFATQRTLGSLIGGDEGAALVADADTALQAMGVVDLEAALRVL